MVYQAIKSALESVDGLAEKVFPNGVCVDDVQAPFCVYQFVKSEEVSDLSGVQFYVDTIKLWFTAESYDEAWALYTQAGAALRALGDSAQAGGCWVFEVQTGSDDPDGIDLTLELQVRAMEAVACWCPLDADEAADGEPDVTAPDEGDGSEEVSG